MKKIIAFIIKYFSSGVYCIYLFTVGFVFTKNRLLISNIADHFDYTKKSTKTKKLTKAIIPKIGLSEIISQNFSIQIREPIAIDGNVSLLEIVVINELIKQFSPSTIFEIGTFNGRTSLNMAANCAENVKIYTLDLEKDALNSTKLSVESFEKKYIERDIIGSKFLETDCRKKITQLLGDSATFDFSPFQNMIDFIFIDGSHSYEYVLSDSRKVLKLLRNGRGVILWHDYDTEWWNGVTKALNEIFLERIDLKSHIKHIQGTSLVYLNIT